ncbi:MAG: uroporphyrinogen decarboxylase family protein [Armatimonadota bacterium]|nr:uroporphyrinogen decarboxylase family protein [Armatimonadota bacterium]
MSDAMTSAERVRAAFRLEEPDRVPILFRGTDPWAHHWSSQVERAQFLLERGADARLRLGVPAPMHPEVTTKLWREEAQPCPILHKLYRTPAGDLHTAVQITPDWQVADIPLYSDHAWPRGVQYLVKTEADLEGLGYVLDDPRNTDLSSFFESAAAVRRSAQELGVIVEGSMRPAPLYAMGFIGGERCLMAVRDEPELIQATLEVVQPWCRAALELLLDAGVDVTYRSNCYETVDLFAPTDIRELFMPLLEEDARICRQAGVPLHGFAQTGIMPLLEDWADAGVSIISSLDPVGPNAMNLQETKRRVGDRCCLMGGVDNRGPFIEGTPEEMEQTVIETLRVMAPGGGYILSPAGMIFPEGRPENLQAFLDAGRRWGRYPLDLP